MHLSPEEITLITSLLERGEKLPSKYRTLLEDAPDVELVWAGKQSTVTRAILPFQSIEQIDEPRSEGAGSQISMFELDGGTGRQSGGWTNKLVWGDNRLVLSSLLYGSIRDEIEAAGGLKLIYIDPPFDVGADFAIEVEVGDADIVKQPSVIEEVAYRDTWGRGQNSYLSMMQERLQQMHGLLADDGYLFVHCDWRVSGQLRVLLDEVFGRDALVNEIVWHYRKWSVTTKAFQKNHDTVFWYVKNPASSTRHFEVVEHQEQSEGTLKRWKGKKQKAVFDETGKRLATSEDEESAGAPLADVWYISIINPAAVERIGYPTQKPEQLLERIISHCTKKDDLVADFFCGSGTTLAVAERLGRRWIGCDLGRFAVHTSRKRLIEVQRSLASRGEPYRSFEVLNLGKYERQFLMGINPNLPSEQKAEIAKANEDKFLSLVFGAYGAERITQTPPFHGRKAGTPVYVGALDAPVTFDDVRAVLDACRKYQSTRADVLGFEFEMGMVPLLVDEARKVGVTLALKYIPKNVFDPRVSDDVRFLDVAYVDASSKTDGLKARVTLEDFGVPYSQDDSDDIAEALKNGGAKVIIDAGQVVRVSKDKQGVVTREVLTKAWSDWIDYWSVDFDFENRPEILKVVEGEEEKEVWSGNYIFENEWQAFRTRANRELELTSAWHEYPDKGTYKVAVKVIDIFGNDTTKVIEVRV